MNLLFLCKRRPQGLDLLSTPYGRFFHLPCELARRGHHVTLLLLSYRNDAVEHRRAHGIEWYSESLRPINGQLGLLAYLKRADQLTEELRPHWVIGLSDTWYGILAQSLAARHGVRCAIDAYDNYEGYIPWALPLHWLWRRALRNASLLTAAGPALAEILADASGNNRAVVVPMAVDPIGFQPLDRNECRRILGLPEDVRIIGYLGSLHPNRGPAVLFSAYRQLVDRLGQTSVQLWLSGRRFPRVRVPADVHWLGYLSQAQMPLLHNALDLLVVVNRDSKFGRYSYPIKLYEAMACGVPVVATDTPATRWILGAHPELLAPPDSATALAARIAGALELGRINYGLQPTWEAGADRFEAAMLATASVMPTP